MTARGAVKRLLESTLRLTIGNPRRMAGHRLILAYHNIVPDGCEGSGDRSLHLPLTRFLNQLDLLQEHCHVRSLPDLLDGAPVPDAPNIAVTFDDAYAGAVDLAIPELDRRRIPSTIFVAPGLLGAPSLWWDELADPARGLSEEVRQDALQRLGGQQARIRADSRFNSTPPTFPKLYACAEESQVRSLHRFPSVSFGAHSWNHPNLARLDPSELRLELARPITWLRETGLPATGALAYPYGITSERIAAAARDAGYTSALLVHGGWLPATGGEPWAVPRYNVPAGLTDDGFLLRLSGVSGR